MASTDRKPPNLGRTRAAAARAMGNGRSRWPTSRLSRQHRPGWIAAGLALVCFAILANVFLVQASSHRVSVLRVVRDVPLGQEITYADVGTAQVALDSGVQSIPGRQLAAMVGRRAAIDLRKGTLLTASEVTTRLTPPPGQAQVTVTLKQSLLPPQGLAPGSQVRVVPTAGTQGPDTSADGTAGRGVGAADRTVPATVDQVGGPDAEGAMTVSLLVADSESTAVAQLASTERFYLVVTARGR